ncbi:hypothetical protein LCGC14_0938800 [marine sediment metagenome]|uniref:Uncharacterized protein n=1 Tax=marine sediment metagenome TaxID=412755 RepID=A0A0F9P6V1_9ZZZZ
MAEAKLLYFRSDGGIERGEYVVLSDGKDPDWEHREQGYTLQWSLTLAVLGDMDDWPVGLPTNVTLSRDFRR